MDNRLIEGDSLEILKTLEDNSVDSIITDPPAGISFMGKQWDSYDNATSGLMGFQNFIAEVFTEAIRVLKPGGHALVWAIPRTSHHTAMGLERAGFEIRDVITHHYGSGFPKSMNICKSIMKMKGDEGKVIGTEVIDVGMQGGSMHSGRPSVREVREVREATDPEAKEWEGWGTALKPATEHWILCRKPIAEKTIADNVLKYGTGGLNIDESRIGTEEREYDLTMTSGNFETTGGGKNKKSGKKKVVGRFPANLILSHSADCEQVKGVWKCNNDCPVKELDKQSGIKKSGMMKAGTKRLMSDNPNVNTYGKWDPDETLDDTYGDIGGASRFFYVAKPSTEERNRGCGGIEPKENTHSTYGIHSDEGLLNNGRNPENRSRAVSNHHPTVKSIALMKYLVKLITKKNGIVLDMFAGSGTTGIACKLEGFNYILIEKDPEYCEIIKARLKAYNREETLFG